MLGTMKYGTAVALLLFTALLFFTGATEEGIFTNHLLVQLHEGGNEDAHQLALEYGFGSARQVRIDHEIAKHTKNRFLFMLEIACC